MKVVRRQIAVFLGRQGSEGPPWASRLEGAVEKMEKRVHKKGTDCIRFVYFSWWNGCFGDIRRAIGRGIRYRLDVWKK
jgi:type II secretory pathway component PulJ